MQIQIRQTPAGASRTMALNTAVAAKVGRDRVGVYQRDNALVLRVNGSVVAPPAKPLTLPSYGNGFTLTWPDHSVLWVDPIGGWGLWVVSTLAPAR